MQGGDVCENAPNLRLDTNNMEIAALTAPRPMLMVSAAGDWTRDTPRIEFPAVESVYELLGAKDAVATVQFIADHNYNRDSREAVYGWFARWLLGRPDASPVPEREFTAEQPADLLVFHGRDLPVGARTQAQIVEGLIEARKAQLAALRPRDGGGSRSLPRDPRPRPAPRAGRGVARRGRPGEPVDVRPDGGRARPRPRPSRPGGPGAAEALGRPAGEPEGRPRRPPRRDRGRLPARELARRAAASAGVARRLDRRLQHRKRPGAARHERPLLHHLQPHGRREPRPGRPHRPRLAEAPARDPGGVPRRSRPGRPVVPSRPGPRARTSTPWSPTPIGSRRLSTRPTSIGCPSRCSAAWAASRRP